MTPAGAPSTPLWHANGVRAEAHRYRVEWLDALDNEVSTTADLFEEACTLEGRPLLRTTLRQILLTDHAFSNARVPKILARIQHLVGVEMPVRHMTVAWLLDPRSGGRRFIAWLDATQEFRSEPWSGFPYRSPFSAANSAATTKNKPGDPR